MSPIFKIHRRQDKENYRPVRIFPHMVKYFERILYKQIDDFMTSKFSTFLCGFRKNHNSQCYLLIMIEIWKKHLDKRKQTGETPMDLWKHFDSTNHRLWSSHRRCSIKTGVLRNFAIFTVKHLCQSLFFNKIADPSLQLY